mmetsp:Transcript_14122/g.59747  ORF Transcript_14122/g.59747 Transcript_14122/m.59747 type:complete len:204 (-) Transcript_14122:49-660(-)
MASATARTSSDRDGSSPSFAAPQMALASSCGLNLDACIIAAVSMPSTRSAARWPSSSLPHAHSILAICLDSTWRGSLLTSLAAASSNRANCSWRILGTPGRADDVGESRRWVSGHLASLWSAVPQFTRLNLSTESLTIVRTSAASVFRASSWFSWTCVELIVRARRRKFNEVSFWHKGHRQARGEGTPSRGDLIHAKRMRGTM